MEPTRGAAPHDVSDYTGYLIRRAQQAHVAAWQRVVSAEITSVQFGVLTVLSRTPGASQQHLVERLDLDRSTIADIVARLERRGLIERVRDGDDRRRNVLHLTELGTRELAVLVPRVALVDDVLVGGLPERDRAELRRLLGGLLESATARTPSG
ncbi:MAG: MarR family transcriptional regulator [Herbiconiux sp.]|uniref:MarR family winged helix-turn-helix transcriptional regulator n=1 Tax=Herbiconiux sp. TaxID=1871186 RepID=UPI0011FF5F6E|nr:MarR family winged helix-turn-helix transcriptional regulator [Herbiconiux sp.]TAJ48583.1 MAG: MarR family transcriptional regulator [Herbiconiux sp.]